MRYFDSSALAKRYLDETDNAAVVARLEHPAATSRLSAVEVASAIVRRGREGKLSQEQRDRALHALSRDMDDLLIVELAPEVVSAANGILTRHALRAADAIHVASCASLCHELRADISFVVFDARLRAAAVAEGLSVEP
ncbi:MAG: type II toxin-antitoxin system VapC family toxin [Acidobacteria bacterium]|nr:type II toxin-antitoxin system VapC family toxin [Acidobacteriota bacterium]